MTRPFGATNAPDTCLWCGRKLRDYYQLGLGYGGQGFFDTLSCSWEFALTMANRGHRIKLTHFRDTQKPNPTETP